MDLTDITGTGKLVLTGDLQIDSLNYLCLTEEAQELKRQLLSVQQIAKDLIELQAMLASMGNFYTLSFLEKYYKK